MVEDSKNKNNKLASSSLLNNNYCKTITITSIISKQMEHQQQQLIPFNSSQLVSLYHYSNFNFTSITLLPITVQPWITTFLVVMSITTLLAGILSFIITKCTSISPFHNDINLKLIPTGQSSSSLNNNNNNTNYTWREDEGTPVYCPISYPEPTSTLQQQQQLQQPPLLPIFSMEEIQTHNTSQDCWIVIHNLVYNVSSFTKMHPGGWLSMAQYAGKVSLSTTDAFEGYHPARVHATILPRYLIGKLSEIDIKLLQEQDNQTDIIIRQIRQQAIQLGLFTSSPSYYVIKGITLLSLFIMAIVISLFSTQYWKCGAILMGIFWQQFAFIGHDVGHNAITQTRLTDLWYGIVTGNTLMGISLGWWKQSHNVHHVNCNSIEHDPDIQHMPVFAISSKMMNDKWWSTYHHKWFDITTDTLARWLISYQHILFYPVMAIARINLYVQSWLALLLQKQGPIPFRKTEILTLSLFFIWIGLVVTHLPEPSIRNGLIWIVLSHATAGILHVQICISHFPMATHKMGDVNRKPGWFSLQLQTTLNVDTIPMLDWIHGGLQFQVEHHCFPRMPRNHLREARQLLKTTLPQSIVETEYHEVPFVKANVLLLQCMKKAADAAREVKTGNGGFYHSTLYDGLNANG
jgi:fatty acid desaturase